MPTKEQHDKQCFVAAGFSHARLRFTPLLEQPLGWYETRCNWV